MSVGLKLSFICGPHTSSYLLVRHIRTPHMLEKLDKSEYVHEEVDTNKDEQNERSDEDYDREDEE